MPELSPDRNRLSRRAYVLATVGFLATTAAQCGGSTANAGPVREIPSIVTKTPTGQPLTLDCAHYVQMTKDGKMVPVNKAETRKLVFESDPGTLYAANIHVKYGFIVLKEDGEISYGLSHEADDDYWVGEKNGGEVAKTSYGSGNGTLPSNDNWMKQLNILHMIDADGTQLPNIGTSPDEPVGDPSVVIAQTSPYFEDAITGQKTTYHDTGTLLAYCAPAIKNKPLPPEQRTQIPVGQVMVIRVPHSSSEPIPNEQAAIHLVGS